MCLTSAPAECSCPDEPSTPRTIVRILPDTTVTSTISSRAVSGSIVMVNVSPADTVAPPRSVDAEPTVIVVAVDETPADNVVFWERDVYFLDVIYAS